MSKKGRILIFTGKGGTGKTSMAAAHAAASARQGKNTLFVSADMAHNLGDIFQVKAGRKECQIRENLTLLELDPHALMREEFPNYNKTLTSLIGSSGAYLESMSNQFILPGFENLFSLLKIRDIYEAGTYDRIVVDCAPTGETLSLLKLPEMLTWYMEKFFPVGKMMVRVLSPISKYKYQLELPSRETMDSIGELHGQMVRLQEFLKDPQVCSVRLVCIPEKMVVEETKRNYMYLNLYEYQVDRIFINRVLPENTGSDFMDHWRQLQQKYVDELEHVFTELPVTKIPWFGEEIRGKAAVDRLADRILEIPDLFAVKEEAERDSYESIEGGYRLSIRLPGAKEGEPEVSLHDMDVNVKIHNFHRCIPLPNTLRHARITNTFLENGKLCIDFLCAKEVDA